MKSGDRISKPWGHEEIMDLNERYCIKRLIIQSGRRLSRQYHEHKRETLILIAGGAWIEGVNRNDLNAWTAMVMDIPYVIEPGTIHRVEGAADSGAVVFEVSTPEIDDVVRLDDDFGRT